MAPLGFPGLDVEIDEEFPPLIRAVVDNQLGGREAGDRERQGVFEIALEITAGAGNIGQGHGPGLARDQGAIHAQGQLHHGGRGEKDRLAILVNRTHPTRYYQIVIEPVDHIGHTTHTA